MVAPTIARIVTVGEVAANSYSKIRRIWITSFYIDGFVTQRTVALKGQCRKIFDLWFFFANRLPLGHYAT
jgi:hypothetical protein